MMLKGETKPGKGVQFFPDFAQRRALRSAPSECVRQSRTRIRYRLLRGLNRPPTEPREASAPILTGELFGSCMPAVVLYGTADTVRVWLFAFTAFA